MTSAFALNDHYQARVRTPFGMFGVRVEGQVISEMVFLPQSVSPLPPQNRLAENAVVQIERYLADPEFRFKLPLMKRGTDFQRRVWDAISTIPSGKTLSYGAIARHVRSGPRAVGQACGANWYPLVIPCHRVVASAGIGGFANQDEGFHLSIKRWLLQHEGSAAHGRSQRRAA
jgi:methylated-DNA-[protein]-cysteine S-methyltransferase